MRLLTRLVLAAAFAVLPAGIAVSSCGTDAVGVQACREIEYARCNLAPTCAPGFDTARCERFYRDHCLLGIQNASNNPDPNTLAQGCVDALTQVSSCAADASNDACEALIPDASCLEVDAAATACNIILDCPEVLQKCAFVGSIAPVTDGGDGGDASDSGHVSDASDAGDAQQTGDAADASDAPTEDAGDAGDAGDAPAD